MLTEPLIECRDVTVRAGGEDTMPGLNLRISAGELWIVAGPTGSGKSLLLETLAGNVPTSAGDLLYRLGRAGHAEVDYPAGAIAAVSPAQHRALASQALDFMQARWSPRSGADTLTVRRLLRRTLSHATSTTMHRALHSLGVAHLLDRDLAALSNGEFRRVLFARALLHRPRVLLLDDPFAGMDVAARQQLHGLIAAFPDTRRAIMMAVPRAEDVPPGATHLLTLAGERVVYAGAFSAARLRRALAAPNARGATRIAAPPPVRPAHAQATGAPLVEMRNVTVRYGNTVALRSLDWTVRAGEKWALRGPNGAGKTTLTNLLLGDHPQAYSNEVYLFGRRRGSGESLWEIKRHIGWMGPELQYTFPAEVSVAAVVYSGLQDTLGLHHIPSRAQRKRAGAWLAFLGIDTLARRAFGALSDGEQRLVLLVRALVKGAPLLVLDEPSQGLDAAHRRLLHRAIAALAKDTGLTMILITHLEEDLPRGTTHELLLSQGRVVRAGEREQRSKVSPRS